MNAGSIELGCDCASVSFVGCSKCRLSHIDTALSMFDVDFSKAMHNSLFALPSLW